MYDDRAMLVTWWAEMRPSKRPGRFWRLGISSRVVLPRFDVKRHFSNQLG
jgi:hypothetical protein